MIWLLAAALAGGWRQDGDGVLSVEPPTSWRTAWSADAGPGGHASPVRVGELLVVTVEPHTLLAVDATTGVERWRRAHPVVDALPPALASSVKEQLAAVPALEAALEEARKRESSLLRDARRADAEVSTADLEGAAAAVETARASLDALAPYREVHQDDIGFAAPTPAVDGDTIYVLFGNGVLAAHGLDGALRWQVWLGRTPADKWGYTGGDAASPQLHGGTLIVPWGTLRGIDPGTGAARWMGPAYPHYGTPALTTVDALPLVLTPAGEVVSATDGRVLATGLPRLFYLSPTAVGAGVWTIGGDGDANSTEPNRATHWTLSRSGDRVTATQAWTTELETRDRFYAAPVVHDGKLYAITRRLDLHVLDAAAGGVVHRGVLTGVHGEAMANLALADGRLFVSTDVGELAEIDTATFALARVHPFERSLATPWLDDGRVYQRGRTHIRCSVTATDN